MDVNKHQTNTQLRKNIGRFLRKLRISMSLTGKELGEMLDISQQQVSRYENGVTSISIDKLVDILTALNSSWSEFYSNVLVTVERQY